MLKSKHFRCENETWEDFKQNCEEMGSNASVEIRKFINSFNKRHNEKDNVNEQVEKVLEIYDNIKQEDDEVLKYLADN